MPGLCAELVTSCHARQRLKEKDDEWKRARASLNKGWKEELERNYEKSLDHRSFYFKQTEKRALTTKMILASAKAAVEEAAKKGVPATFEVRSTLHRLSPSLTAAL